eukprot:tig00000624_g2642.t1
MEELRALRKDLALMLERVDSMIDINERVSPITLSFDSPLRTVIRKPRREDEEAMSTPQPSTIAKPPLSQALRMSSSSKLPRRHMCTPASSSPASSSPMSATTPPASSPASAAPSPGVPATGAKARAPPALNAPSSPASPVTPAAAPPAPRLPHDAGRPRQGSASGECRPPCTARGSYLTRAGARARVRAGQAELERERAAFEEEMREWGRWRLADMEERGRQRAELDAEIARLRSLCDARRRRPRPAAAAPAPRRRAAHAGARAQGLLAQAAARDREQGSRRGSAEPRRRARPRRPRRPSDIRGLRGAQPRAGAGGGRARREIDALILAGQLLPQASGGGSGSRDSTPRGGGAPSRRSSSAQDGPPAPHRPQGAAALLSASDSFERMLRVESSSLGLSASSELFLDPRAAPEGPGGGGGGAHGQEGLAGRPWGGAGSPRSVAATRSESPATRTRSEGTASPPPLFGD